MQFPVLRCNDRTYSSSVHQIHVLSLESQESNNGRVLGEIFLYLADELSDITWIQAFQLLLEMFRSIPMENTELSDEKVNELVDAFMDMIPVVLKSRLQAA